METEEVKLRNDLKSPDGLFTTKEDVEFSQNIFNLFERIKASNMVTDDSLKKSYVIAYFLNDPNLFKIFDITPADFIEEILNYESSENNRLYPNELVQILEQPRPSISIEDINDFSRNNELRGKDKFLRYYFLMTKEDMKQLQNKYNKIRDAFGRDNILEFIETLHNDEIYFEDLNRLVYYIEPINKILTLSHVLLCMRIEILENKELYGDLKYHNWDRVDTYIKQFELKAPLKDLFGVPPTVVELFRPGNKIDIEFLPSLRNKFNSLSCREGYVSKEDLLIAIANDEYLNKQMDVLVRDPGLYRKGINDELANENFTQLLDRIDKEAEDFISWEDFRQYFTRRGFPM